jgi:signal transduction histidine kinase
LLNNKKQIIFIKPETKKNLMLIYNNYIRKIIVFIFFFILFIACYSSKAQDINRCQSLVAYVNNFCKYTEWNSENLTEEFNILLISDNEELISVFGSLAYQKKINKKNIKLTVQSKPEIDLNTTHLIFIDENKLFYYFYIFEQVQNHNILIVSDNYDDQRFVMINLFDADDGRLLFEINKSNIINQGLTINSEILLLGGSEIDVAELFRESQITLLGMEIELQNSKKQLDSIKEQIPDMQNEISIKGSQIIAQNELMQEKENRIKNQELKFEELNLKILAKERVLQYQLNQLAAKNDSLLAQTSLLSEQEKLFTEQNTKLDEQQIILNKKYEEIEKMDKDIEEKNQKLGIQNLKIIRQRNFIFLFALIAFLTVVLVLVLLRSYRNRKIMNFQLTEKTNHIEEINKDLKTSNEELVSKNDQLNDANTKLSSALDILKKTQLHLVQSEKMASLGILTAGIAHEINNPINFVYTGINSLKKDFEDLVPILNEIKKLNNENHQEYNQIIEKIINLKQENYFEEAFEAIPITIQDIHLGADRTADIVKGLRNFSSLDKQTWETVDLHNGIDSTLLLLKNAYKNRIEVIKKYNPDLPPVQCFPGKINQVFMNIIKNSIDAIPDKGIIEISTNFTKFGVVITIKDNGIGIDSNIIPKLFDPFFTTKKVGKGVGLGLSISYGIVHEHKGKILVNSELGNGTEFIIKLPIFQV